jgi:hypothetical protein
MVFDNVLNQVFIITHINPDTQNYEDAQVRLDEISNKITGARIQFKIEIAASQVRNVEDKINNLY